MTKTTKALVWFRHDLRLQDNPALYEACKRGYEVIPVFIWDPHSEGDWAPGAASRVWLHHSLKSLQESFEKVGSKLILRQGPTLEALKKFIQETKAQAIFWNRRYEPSIITRDQSIKTVLKEMGIEAESFNGSLLHEPWDIKNNQGLPYQVFTAYWNRIQSLEAQPSPLPTPKIISPKPPHSETLDDFKLLPRIHWDQKMMTHWTPGETGAHTLLSHFYKSSAADYPQNRDIPSLEGTSKLSPHLHFGEISPRQIWAQAQGKHTPYLRQIVWREFSYYLLYHFPHTPTEPLREEFKKFSWDHSKTAQQNLKKWQRGETGFPIVDAGMRELWETGWMHNRVRMIAASFLVKDLMIPWQEGARWFWDTLVDADLANNTMGWQWVAGCGADASPYFRIFNPELQTQKFDPQKKYIQQWVQTSHPPIVSHDIQRKKALAAYAKLKG